MQIPTANDIPVDFRVTLLRNAPCDRTPMVHSSKAVGEPPFFLGKHPGRSGCCVCCAALCCAVPVVRNCTAVGSHLASWVRCRLLQHSFALCWAAD